MDKGLNKAFEKLTEALQYTRDKDVISIKACMNVDKDGFHKEVAKITSATARRSTPTSAETQTRRPCMTCSPCSAS